MTNIGQKGLDRKKLLPPGQVTTLLSTLLKITSAPKTTPKPKRTEEREQSETESQEKAPTLRRRSTAPHRTEEREQPEKETQEQPSTPPRRSTAPKWVATPEIVEAAHNSTGWHGVMNSERANVVLGDGPKGWLLRENKDQL